jgi:hypothetical protein
MDGGQSVARSNRAEPTVSGSSLRMLARSFLLNWNAGCSFNCRMSGVEDPEVRNGMQSDALASWQARLNGCATGFTKPQMRIARLIAATLVTVTAGSRKQPLTNPEVESRRRRKRPMNGRAIGRRCNHARPAATAIGWGVRREAVRRSVGRTCEACEARRIDSRRAIAEHRARLRRNDRRLARLCLKFPRNGSTPTVYVIGVDPLVGHSSRHNESDTDGIISTLPHKEPGTLAPTVATPHHDTSTRRPRVFPVRHRHTTR